jgi:hypothetical protein
VLRKLQIALMAFMLTTVLGTQVFAEDMGTTNNNPYANPAGNRDGYTNTAGNRDGYTNTAGYRDGYTNTAGYRGDNRGARTTAAPDGARRRDWGWLGLLGLAGLLGARGGNKNPQPNRNQP